MVKVSRITRGWIEVINHELKLISDNKKDEDMKEDKEAITFIQEVYIRIILIIEKILSGDNNDKLYIEILEANNIIIS